MSEICKQRDFDQSWFSAWKSRLAYPNSMHRKQWEQIWVTQSLHERNVLAAGKAGLGFGVGDEPLVPLFASFGCKITATDAPPDPSNSLWADTKQYTAEKSSLANERLCPSKIFEKNVSFEFVDMRKIPKHIRGFDFAWSVCSMEHLGSIEAGLKFLEDSMECLKPGGFGIHTMEYNLSSNGETWDGGLVSIYRRSDIDQIISRLWIRGHAVVPVNWETRTGAADDITDSPPYTGTPHLRLWLGPHKATSLGLIIEAHHHPAL
jgi:hypothetical protein